MVNDEKTCRELYCEGRMVFKGTKPAGARVAGEATSHVDVYECDECGAEDWDYALSKNSVPELHKISTSNLMLRR